MPFYAVRTGRQKGTFSSWEECETNVKNFPNATFARFETLDEACLYMSSELSARQVKAQKCTPPTPPASSAQCKPPKNTAAADNKEPAAIERLIGSEGRTSRRHNIFLAPSGQPSAAKNVVYTDGSCCMNGKKNARAGYGVFWPDNADRCCYGPLAADTPQTNQRAELTAIWKALESARPVPGALEICTDSKYCIGGLTKWFKEWERQGWAVPVKNIDLFRDIIEACREREDPVFMVHPDHPSLVITNRRRGTYPDTLAILGTSRLIGLRCRVPNVEWESVDCLRETL